jgi:hypothetical protein
MPMIAAKASWLPSAAREGEADLLTLTLISSETNIEVIGRMNSEPEHQNPDSDSEHD